MANEQILQEEKLIVSYNDHQQTLKELYHLHYHDLYYYGIKLSGSDETAKDCIQDLFMQFWSNSDLLDQVKSVKAYLLKCLRRRIFYQLGKDTKSCDLNSVSGRNEQSCGSAEESFIIAESDHILEKNLKIARESLTSRQQEILYLKYNLGYSYELICEIMEIKYQSVRNLLSEAIRALRIKLDT